MKPHLNAAIKLIKSYKVFFAIFSGIFLILIINSTTPLMIGSDQANGFMAWKFYISGSKFNYIVQPNPKLITSNYTYWLSWWSPGQYAIPGFISKEFNISLANATLFTVYLFSSIGVTGYFMLFRRFGFTISVTLTSLLVICSQRYFLFPFTIYNGGEILLFGFLPWVVLLFDIWFYRKSIFLLIPICIFGIFLKLTFFISILSILLYVNVKNLKHFNLSYIVKYQLKNPSQLLRTLLIGLTSMAAIIFNNHLGSYSSPSQTSNFCLNSLDILIPFSAPIVSSFCVDDLLTKFIDFNIPGSGWYSINGISCAYPEFFFIPIVFAVFFILSRLKSIKRGISIRYVKLFISFFVVFNFIFIYLYTFNANISYESRHFRMLGILFTPILVVFIKESIANRLIIIIPFSFITFFSIYGISGFLNRKLFIKQNMTICNYGFANTEIPNSTIDKIKHLDIPTKNNDILFYCSSAGLALEINNNRVLYYDDDFIEESTINRRKVQGKVKKLYIIVPKKFSNNNKSSLIQRSFRNYSKFQCIFEDNTYQIFRGN